MEKGEFDRFVAEVERHYGVKLDLSSIKPDQLEEGEVLYLVPDYPEHKPEWREIPAENFMTEDGRVPVIIRDEEGAREHYAKLVRLQLYPMKPGKELSEDEFVDFAMGGGRFEVVKRNDANDDGEQGFWKDSADEARNFHQKVRLEGKEIRVMSEWLDEDGFVKMAVEGMRVNVLTSHFDGAPRMIRGLYIGFSDGGGFKQPSLTKSLWGPEYRQWQ